MAFYILLTSALLQLLGGILYIKTMIYGGTKVNRVPWFLVAFSAFVATGAALYEGATWSVLPGVMAGFAPCLILIAFFTVPNAYWKSSGLDYFCGFLSLLALTLWVYTHNGIIGLILAILADVLASIPLVIKAWKHPETESSAEFLAALLSSAASLFVIGSWNIAEWGFSLYLVFMCSLLTFSVERKRLRKFLYRG